MKRQSQGDRELAMSKRRSRAANGAVLQPSLLRSLTRPSEPEHLPAWAARVRERLGVVEAQLRRLEREKQTLLGQLLGAPSTLVDAVLAPLQSQRTCSPIRHASAVSSTAPVAPAARQSLWVAAAGDSTARLRAAAQTEGERVHPALAAASAHDPMEELVECAEQAEPEPAASPSPTQEMSVKTLQLCTDFKDADCKVDTLKALIALLEHTGKLEQVADLKAVLRSLEVSEDETEATAASSTHFEVAVLDRGTAECSVSPDARDQIAASPSPLRHRAALDLSPPEAGDGASAGDDVAPTAADDTACELLSPESPARPPERLCFSPTACGPKSPSAAAAAATAATSARAVSTSSPAASHAGLHEWSPPPRSLVAVEQMSPGSAVDDGNVAGGAESADAGESCLLAASMAPETALEAQAGPEVPSSSDLMPLAYIAEEYSPPTANFGSTAASSHDEDGATRLARLLGRDFEDSSHGETSAAAMRLDRSPSLAPTILSSSEDECPQAEPAQVETAPSTPPRTTSASGGLLERILHRRSHSHSDSDAPLAQAQQASTARDAVGAGTDASAAAASNSGDSGGGASSSTSVRPANVRQASASSGMRCSRICPEDLGDEALKKLMRFFGMKPVSSHGFMVKRLLEIDTYLNGTQDDRGKHEVAAETHADSSRARGCGRGRGRGRGRAKKRPLAEAGGEDAAVVAQEEKIARLAASDAAVATARDLPPGASPMASSTGLQGQVEPSPKLTSRAARAADKAEAIEQLVADVIRRDTELYERMLLFEPIEIGELRERLSALEPELRGLGEQRLRKFLDAHGLVFANGWQGQNNSGGHRRF